MGSFPLETGVGLCQYKVPDIESLRAMDILVIPGYFNGRDLDVDLVQFALQLLHAV